MIYRAAGGDTVEVTFALPPQVVASSAHVCGEFNDWSPTANPMSALPNGGFATTLTMTVGRRWAFRYLLDGNRWENDWAADDYAPNMHGGEDSILDLTPTQHPRFDD